MTHSDSMVLFARNPKGAALYIFALWGGLGVLSGCGSSAQDDSASAAWRAQVASCPSLNANQTGSFMAPIGSGPVQVLVDNTFTADQLASVQTEVAQWNQLAEQTRGSDFFVVQSATIPAGMLSANPQTCTNDYGLGSSGFYLVNAAGQNSLWQTLGFSNLNPGATVRCYSDDSLMSQVSLIRPDLVGTQQFSSVIIHELGHSLGLDHSCQGSGGGSATFLSCNGLSWDDPYSQAVMYPTLGLEGPNFTSVQIKEQLAPNDIQRTGCLYP